VTPEDKCHKRGAGAAVIFALMLDLQLFRAMSQMSRILSHRVVLSFICYYWIELWIGFASWGERRMACNASLLAVDIDQDIRPWEMRSFVERKRGQAEKGSKAEKGSGVFDCKDS
jgi:hypothetical protein